MLSDYLGHRLDAGVNQRDRARTDMVLARVVDPGRFEQGLLAEMRVKGGDLLETIRTEREISKDTEEKLKAFFDGYAKAFA